MAEKKEARRGRTFEERFVDELARQGATQDESVSNRSLRAQLGWQDERFDKVRATLLKKGVIKAAQGYGGKTKFAQTHAAVPAKKVLKAFVSYSHHDEKLKDGLIQHLRPLERLGLISIWHDRKIKPGDDLNGAISSELDQADLIFLLVSVDFINSAYCYDKELSRAIERHEAKSARVIPIILRKCLWTHSPFGGVSALPKDGQAITTFANIDEGFSVVADAILDLVAES